MRVRQVECIEFGAVDSLRVVERPPIELPAGHIRVAVRASGVNFVDGLLVQGRYQIKPPLPFVPGMEAVGVVTELAPDIDRTASCRVGDRVLVNVGFGGYASEVVAPVGHAVTVPGALSDGQAASFMQSHLTGWFALRERARVVAGQSILVLGAGSGVGLAAVDLAAAAGLRVIAAASTADKRRLALDRGADAVIDTSALTPEDVKQTAREFGMSAGGHGVDLVYDPIGGLLGEQCLRALGDDGQYLVIGFVAGIPALPANQILLRNRRVVGVDWGAWASRNSAANHALLTEVLEMIDAGTIEPVEPSPYPLEEAGAALADLAARRIAGKVVLIP